MKEEDLHITYTRGSGPGGQHKNKVETCVVITHKPTGISVRCQETRSRHWNLELAKKNLHDKLETAQQDKLKKLRKEQRDERIKNNKVIRTYNYIRNEVYDHRTKVKRDLKRVMNGDIDYE